MYEETAWESEDALKQTGVFLQGDSKRVLSGEVMGKYVQRLCYCYYDIVLFEQPMKEHAILF